MLLVTVGTEQYQFNALMHWIELLTKYQIINEEVIVQYGSSTYFPDGSIAYRLLSEQEFQKFIHRASIIISHCEEGIAQLLEDKDKPYVLVPRLQRFREHVDNHQMEVADDFERRGIAVARSAGDLVKFIKLQQTSEVVPQVDETLLCEYLKERFDEGKLMLVCSSGGNYRYMQSLKAFWENYSDRTWVTFRNGINEREIEDSQRYWAHSPTNRNIPNLIRNLFLAFNVVRHQKPELIVSTGAGVAVPFLLIAKLFCRSKVIFIESKTRIRDVSLSAQILIKLRVLDLLIVRSEAISNVYRKAVYIPVSDTSETIRKKDYKQAKIATFEEIAFIYSPERLEFFTAREFFSDFQAICNADDSYRKIVIDMSHTTFIDGAGLGALINCLKQAKAYGTELVLWSVSGAVMSLLTVTSLSKAFVIESASQTFRFSESTQRIRVSNLTSFGLFLFRVQRLLQKTPILRIFHPILKFWFPAIDIDPGVPVHPSVRDPIKRFIDIVGALIGLGFTAIFFIPIAIAIASESRGNVLFGQVRCGLLSKPFRIWKFRSMVKNAEELKIKVENQVEATAQSHDNADKFFKNANDPRVTRIGSFLRRTSLDEFPQFWNVLTGDMSLVGTRPPTFDEINAYELDVEYQDERYTEWNRLDVKPGMTGVWQVNGRSNVRSFAEVVNFDIEYRKKWSIGYDLQLIVKTIVVLFDRKNKAV
ncbi:sugar transferase [Tumidithrix elongata RA019]|uniref:Sugar transferase n=1 Tax=Tumidithrix elongata BACA0141 TaxID=2716417 RepID=A0AAW9Q9W4_9CYAN|nr:sugar transferase [Tumidithrix elongata RA019]